MKVDCTKHFDFRFSYLLRHVRSGETSSKCLSVNILFSLLRNENAINVCSIGNAQAFMYGNAVQRNLFLLTKAQQTAWFYSFMSDMYTKLRGT